MVKSELALSVRVVTHYRFKSKLHLTSHEVTVLAKPQKMQTFGHYSPKADE